MNEQFTQNLMMKCLYGEASEAEVAILEQEIASDWTVKEEFEMYQQVLQLLGTDKKSPDPSSIKIIKRHSR